MTKIDTSRPETVLPTPSHTVGPFYGHALPFPGGGDIAPIGHPDTIVLQGYITDGEGNPLPDAFVELWSADPDGNVPQADGSIRRDPATGGYLGRNGVEFTGWGRIQTDANGHWTARTLRPGARGQSAPYISVCVFARGLLVHLYTRIYLPGDEAALTADPLLARVPVERRDTLIARRRGDGTYRFDIRLQGEGETVFLEFQ
ncbi:protocatechuate 3,4-dioxygenase subunit alpha [Streptomyces canus]|uniref:protocatechuate 3,4-dioxygenase subunit alpha n=1 Tax=Streptomyces canus TaxID=58343 RepID=UPI002256CFF8|nr:protocatechuate 3,4-dioxygenase subunit alpha [Streptomyces canus]MCX5253403.1 protocatechuate 3,4-dioxygenase subunit alpha [Streptomyces canus]